MVFFPSYRMLQDVYEIFEEKSLGWGWSVCCSQEI